MDMRCPQNYFKMSMNDVMKVVDAAAQRAEVGDRKVSGLLSAGEDCIIS